MTNKEYNAIIDRYTTFCERYNSIIDKDDIYETEIDYTRGGIDAIEGFINIIGATIKKSYDISGYINHFYLEADVFGAICITTRKIRKPNRKREA